MYKHNDHYLKFCILQCSFVLTIQKVNYVGLSSNAGTTTIVNLSKRTFVCVLWSTINSEPHRKCWFDEWSVLDTTITWVPMSRNNWQVVSALRLLVVKRVLNRIWNWLKASRYKLVFTKMVFDSRLQLCDRKRKQEHFSIILWRSLELLKGNKSQKTIPVTWQYNCLH